MIGQASDPVIGARLWEALRGGVKGFVCDEAELCSSSSVFCFYSHVLFDIVIVVLSISSFCV